MKLVLVILLSLLLPAVALAQHTVALSWSASPTPNVTYNMYRGTVSGGPYSKINTSTIAALTFTDTLVSNGTTYFYVVRAVDSSNVESVNSNESSAVIPQGPQPPTALTNVVH